jgi:NitT/TauT family transport system permease protein
MRMTDPVPGAHAGLGMSASELADAPVNAGPKRRQLVDLLGPFVVFVVFIGVWYALAYGIDGNFAPNGKPLLIPAPHQTFSGVSAVLGKIWSSTQISFWTALLGLAIAMTLGVGLAIAMSQARWVERALYPYLVALQAVPILAMIPLIIAISGANFRSRVITTVLISIFPIVSNTLFGLLSAERNQHDLFTLNSASRWTRLSKLQIPAAMPAMFTGFRISAGLSVIGAVVGDFFFAKGNPGLGRRINDYFLNNQPSRMTTCAIIAALLGILFFVTFGWISNKAVGHWHESSRKDAI